MLTGSIAGFMPGTFTAVYNGTKAFVDSFSFALRAELKDAGVTVTCLMPGGVTAPLRAFQFAVKIPRAITHELKLQRAREPFVIFLAQTDGLAEKRGPLLLQPLGGMRNLQLIGRILIDFNSLFSKAGLAIPRNMTSGAAWRIRVIPNPPVPFNPISDMPIIVTSWAPDRILHDLETAVTKRICLFVVLMALSFLPEKVSAQQVSPGDGRSSAPSQQNQPPATQRTEAEAERAARRFRIGVQGGVGLDPEIIDVGVHAAFGPVFRRNVDFRPVFELGLGELTTTLGINLDVLYSFPGSLQEMQWTPYVGGGPHFGLSHQSFATDDADNVDVPEGVDEDSRFDFSDTDFDGGMNFIVGMRKQSGTFFEMKATAWGVSNIRLLVGFNF